MEKFIGSPFIYTYANGWVHDRRPYEGMPPFLVMHGSNDRLVSLKQSEQLYEALKAKGNKVDYAVLEGAGHGDLYWFQRPVIEKGSPLV